MSELHSVALADIVAFAEVLLTPSLFKDYDGAQNGLQFENLGRVRRIAAAVDGTLPVARKATAAGCDLLLVHHGMRPGASLHLLLVHLLLRHLLPLWRHLHLRHLHLRHLHLHRRHSIWSRVRWDHRPARKLP